MPYIDVMLVLLVIFMATAPLLTQGVEIDLPNVDSDLPPRSAPSAASRPPSRRPPPTR